MPLRLQCPRCRSVLVLADALLGRRVQCSICKQLIDVALPRPTVESAVQAAPPRPPREEVPAPSPAARKGSGGLLLLAGCAVAGLLFFVLVVVAGVGAWLWYRNSDTGPAGPVASAHPTGKAAGNERKGETGAGAPGLGLFSSRTGGTTAKADPNEDKPANGGTRPVGETAFVDLKLKAARAPRCLTWAPDGKAFYFLDADGTVHRIARDTFKEETRAESGHKCPWLALSSEGVVLTVADLQEAWLLDPRTLQTVKRIHTPLPSRIVSTPALPVAFSSTGEGANEKITVLDLIAGNVAGEYWSRGFGPLVGCGLATVSPDGKYLFGIGMDELHRWSIQGTQLVYEQATEQIAANTAAVVVSDDSRYVAVVPNNGNSGAGNYGLPVFPVNALKKAALTLDFKPGSAALAWDQNAGWIYGQDRDQNLVLFNPLGVRQKEYRLGPGGALQLLPHPEGGRLLVLTETSVLSTELPKSPTAVAAAPKPAPPPVQTAKSEPKPSTSVAEAPKSEPNPPSPTTETAKAEPKPPAPPPETPKPSPPPSAPTGQSAQMPPELLRKVKDATVHFKVTLPDGGAEGSGFLTDLPGIVVTNAHVLSMLAPESRQPNRIEVTLRSGTEQSRTLVGQVIGVDRESDLAVVRIPVDKELPAPLSLGSTANLIETQSVFVFGFPFGQGLGKEITINRGGVSSIRKAGGAISMIQIDGGLNPGNSGGPVVDTEGHVIGVAVSGVRGTNIGNAIPAEKVGRFLAGSVLGVSSEVPYRDGDRDMMEVTFQTIDPLGRLQKLEVEVWAGNPGKHRPPSATEPEALPGDSEKQRYPASYDGKAQQALVTVPLPPVSGQQIYWIQPIVTNGAGKTRWLSASPVPVRPPLDRRALALNYRPPQGGKQTAHLTSNGEFRIRNRDGEEFALGINLQTNLSETFGMETPKSIPVRLGYDTFGLTINLGGKPIQKDAELRKMQTDIRFAAANLEMDKDGSVANAKADLRRVPQGSLSMISDLSDQVLGSVEVLSIPLPQNKMEPLQTWKAQQTFMIGCAVIAVPVQADITYKYLGVQTRDGKEGALLRINGRVRGRKGDGVDASGSITGTALISLETGEVLSADTTIKADFDVTYERKSSKAFATLAVSIKRPAPR